MIDLINDIRRGLSDVVLVVSDLFTKKYSKR